MLLALSTTGGHQVLRCWAAVLCYWTLRGCPRSKHLPGIAPVGYSHMGAFLCFFPNYVGPSRPVCRHCSAKWPCPVEQILTLTCQQPRCPGILSCSAPARSHGHLHLALCLLKPCPKVRCPSKYLGAPCAGLQASLPGHEILRAQADAQADSLCLGLSRLCRLCLPVSSLLSCRARRRASCSSALCPVTCLLAPGPSCSIKAYCHLLGFGVLTP